VTTEEPEPLPYVTANVPEGTPLVETNTGLQVPSQFYGAYVNRAAPLVVHVSVTIEDDGTPDIRQIVMLKSDEAVRDHRRITSADTRLPIPTILDAVLHAAAEQGATKPLTRPSRDTRRVLTPELLDEVANIVRDATARGLPIRRAVADHFRLGSQLTARNWINKAREPGGPLHRDDQEGKEA
jgi:hypothetical protein